MISIKLKGYLAITIFLVLTNCNVKPTTTLPTPTVTDKCPAYFEFDQLTHYEISITDDSVAQLQERRRNEKEEKLFEILSDRVFDEKYSMTSLADTIKLFSLEKVGFVKKEISKEKFQPISAVFCEKHSDENDQNMCLPVYRDIILFREQNRVVGFARICFDCEISNIVGSNRDTYSFGEAGEFEVLERLLK
jgi:hypothetical protein